MFQEKGNTRGGSETEPADSFEEQEVLQQNQRTGTVGDEEVAGDETRGKHKPSLT